MIDQRLIPLSALQHYAYCPRQCALIHIEQAWGENWLTAQGQLLHQRVDSGEPETRRGIRYERGVAVCAPKLGLTGKLDLIEIDLSSGICSPVEYKRGKPKIDNWDRIQLCAQVLCLEEMLDCQIPHAALWYWQTRHREAINLTATIREETLQVIAQVKDLFNANITPKAMFDKKCNACSLIDQCNPQLSSNDKTSLYIKKLYNLNEPDYEKTTK